jgi:hypothetical protein
MFMLLGVIGETVSTVQLKLSAEENLGNTEKCSVIIQFICTLNAHRICYPANMLRLTCDLTLGSGVITKAIFP